MVSLADRHFDVEQLFDTIERRRATNVVIVGQAFAGPMLEHLDAHPGRHDLSSVTVVSSSDEFLFTPSLIWVPFGKRTRADITFKVGPTFEEHEDDFVHAEATAIDPEARRVETTAGPQDYDYLVIATGYRNRFDVIPGLGEGGNAHTITTMELARVNVLHTPALVAVWVTL